MLPHRLPAAALLLAQIVLNPPRNPSTIQVDVNLVNVLCTVRDKHGAYVKGLSKEDFDLREDGKRQEISLFAREVDSPLTVALLLDVSGSVEMVLGREKAAAQRFFSEALRPADQAMLVGFAQLIAVWQDLTPSREVLQSALEQAGPFRITAEQKLETRPRGGTLLYDSVVLVASHKLSKLPGRKVLILITDGLDNGSIASLEKAIKAAQEADTVIYGIHYEDETMGVHYSGMMPLNKLSDETGGRAFHVDTKLPLEAVFAAVGEEMRNQYALGYRPPDHDKSGSFHHLQVRLAQSGLKAQSRTGYYTVQK
jgi:Ca-activated chloride channel family protein